MVNEPLGTPIANSTQLLSSKTIDGLIASIVHQIEIIEDEISLLSILECNQDVPVETSFRLMLSQKHAVACFKQLSALRLNDSQQQAVSALASRFRELAYVEPPSNTLCDHADDKEIALCSCPLDESL